MTSYVKCDRCGAIKEYILVDNTWGLWHVYESKPNEFKVVKGKDYCGRCFKEYKKYLESFK